MGSEKKTPKQQGMVRPLHFAILSRARYRIVTLLNEGAHVNALDKAGNTPLNEALQQPDFPSDLIQLMLLKGAKINLGNAVGDTPWHTFCAHLKTWDKAAEQKAILLLKAGCDLTALNQKNKTGVLVAPFVMREKVVQLANRYGVGAKKIVPGRKNALQKQNDTYEHN